MINQAIKEYDRKGIIKRYNKQTQQKIITNNNTINIQ